MAHMIDTTAPVRLGQFIDGRERPAEAVIEVRNPSRTSHLVGTVAAGTVADVDAAVDAAAAAASTWAATSAEVRIDLFTRIADAIDADADDLATLVAQENGSVREIIRRELIGAAAAFRGIGSHLPGKLAPMRHDSGPDGAVVVVSRKPFGVVACIVPWNAPLVLTANKIAPAIAAGNTVVLKPSPFAPLGVTLIGRLAASILPAGVVNIVNGQGEVGAALIGHASVRKISFTGGGETARHVMRQAADRLTGVHFELGGNDPAIVLSDADLAVTADRIADSAFRRAGQVCFAVKRIYVPRAQLAEFGELLAERVDAITVGDALDPRATMGPLNNAGQFEKVRGLRERAVAAGRDVRQLGTVLDPDAWDEGYFLRPTVVLDAEHDDELVREEQFGPVLPVVAYDTEEEAIAMANDTEYGLCSSVWSRSLEHATEVAGRIESGMTIVNSHLFSPVGTREIPFGGWKQSGVGWEGSPYGIDEYLQFHSVDVQTLPDPSVGRAADDGQRR
ncbi:aldehyde dehydrogenase family protein [Microbacterium kribbense]|uniref:Aldehyde dehydrogenase family protein n=1 Tax=Microbacterium kribbense TaxID=433645 RepID=A0ABP7G0I0_9MICO